MYYIIKFLVELVLEHDNGAADWLDKYGLSLQSTMMWNEAPHRDLIYILYKDNLGRTLEGRAN